MNIPVGIEQACRNPFVDADFRCRLGEEGGDLNRQQVGRLPFKINKRISI